MTDKTTGLDPNVVYGRTIEAMAVELDKLIQGSNIFRNVALECVKFLSDPRWETWEYMEGSQIYLDRDNLLRFIQEALEGAKK